MIVGHEHSKNTTHSPDSGGIETMNAKERLARLTQVLEVLKGRDFLIVLTQLDPDAIGGGLAFKFLLKKGVGIDATIGYFGAIDNQQNKTIFNLYDLSRIIRPLS